MLRSLPAGDEDGGGGQVPLGCSEGCPGRGGLWGHLQELHPQCRRLST